jgi:hypothetical protein
MQTMSRSLTAGVFSVALLSACGAPHGGNFVVPTGNAAAAAPRFVDRPAKHAGLRALYVLDYHTGYIDILHNDNYRELGSISDGSNLPQDLFLDTRGNLYVANGVGSIGEYAPNATSPSFTYNAGMHAAFAVTVDAHGDVFEGDGNGGLGSINEYYQGVNNVLYSCPVSSSVEAIAIDSSNDVFVTVGGKISEFPGGLRGCGSIPLSVPALSPFGIAVDQNSNLIVCDDGGGAVDVVPPPYSSVARTIGTGWGNPYLVTLSKDNKLAFATDLGRGLITVIDYQTGANVTTLGGGNGLVLPLAAVDGPNAVY